MSTKFHDRKEAGLLLAERLKVYANNNNNNNNSDNRLKTTIFKYSYNAIVLILIEE